MIVNFTAYCFLPFGEPCIVLVIRIMVWKPELFVCCIPGDKTSRFTHMCIALFRLPDIRSLANGNILALVKTTCTQSMSLAKPSGANFWIP